MVLQPDGGRASGYAQRGDWDNHADMAVVRLDVAGQPDATFGTGRRGSAAARRRIDGGYRHCATSGREAVVAGSVRSDDEISSSSRGRRHLRQRRDRRPEQ
jgi:hypothetical protein